MRDMRVRDPTTKECESVTNYAENISKQKISANTAIRIACETIDDFEVEDGYKIKRAIENRIKDYLIFQF